MSDTDASPKGLLVLFAIFALMVTVFALNVNDFLDILATTPR